MTDNQYRAIFQNQKLIQVLRLHPSLDRIKIAEKVNISSPTLYKTFDELKRNGILNDDNMIEPSFGTFVGFSIGTSVCKIVFLHFDFSIFKCNEFNPFRERFVDLFEQKMRELNISDKENIIKFNSNPNNNYIYFQTPTEFNTLKHYFDAICSGLIEFVENNQLHIISIGVSSTGTIDRFNQTICEAHNLEYLAKRSIDNLFYPDKNDFFRRQQIGVYLVQNSAAATIAETFELYQRTDNSTLLNSKSIATVYLEYGIGTGFVFDGKLFSGANGYAGEIGHIPISNNVLEKITNKDANTLFENKNCSCGASDCIDNVIRCFVFSANDDDKDTTEKFKNMGSTAISEYLKEDHTKARALGLILGYITNLLTAILNIDLVIFTGKLYRSFSELEKYIYEALDDNHLKYNRSDCNIHISKIGTLAPAIGAAIYSFYSKIESDLNWD